MIEKVDLIRVVLGPWSWGAHPDSKISYYNMNKMAVSLGGGHITRVGCYFLYGTTKCLRSESWGHNKTKATLIKQTESNWYKMSQSYNPSPEVIWCQFQRTLCTKAWKCQFREKIQTLLHWINVWILRWNHFWNGTCKLSYFVTWKDCSNMDPILS